MTTVARLLKGTQRSACGVQLLARRLWMQNLYTGLKKHVWLQCHKTTSLPKELISTLRYALVGSMVDRCPLRGQTDALAGLAFGTGMQMFSTAKDTHQISLHLLGTSKDIIPAGKYFILRVSCRFVRSTSLMSSRSVRRVSRSSIVRLGAQKGTPCCQMQILRFPLSVSSMLGFLVAGLDLH